MKRVCVFCGSNPGTSERYPEAARALGTELARRGVGLVFGGGRVGLMGAVADAALAAGGEVIGVIPRALVRRELAHSGVKDMRVVGSMHERKALMESLSDGFIAMPGGLGTLDELCEILTWSQLGIHGKPTGLLNVGGYFDRFLSFLDGSVQEGFVRAEHRARVLVEAEPAALLEALARQKPAAVEKWHAAP